MENYFTELNGINVSDKIEKKNNLSYLSWAYAWQEVKKLHPDATYTVYENQAGWNYHTDGKTGWVKTGVTVNGIEHIEYLPIMDYKNRSIPLDNITSFDVNKTIQRSLTKAVARHGLGLYIYAGEDLPEPDQELADEMKKEVSNQKRKDTIEKKKQVEQAKNTKEYALQRFDVGVAFVKKLAQINPNTDMAVMKAINQVKDVLMEQGLEKELEEFNNLINSKIIEPVDDSITY